MGISGKKNSYQDREVTGEQLARTLPRAGEAKNKAFQGHLLGKISDHAKRLSVSSRGEGGKAGPVWTDVR